MTDSSLYSPDLRAEFIQIPSHVLTFFRQRGKYIPLPKKYEPRTEVSYRSIVGENAEQVPKEYTEDDSLKQIAEEYPFTNKDSQSKEKSDQAAIAAIKALLGSGRYGDVQKTYMINTSTVPIRINFSQDGKGSRKTIYAKRPDVNRIVGRFFYDIISGREKTPYMFNRAVYLEANIPGSPLSRLDEKMLLQSDNYKKGLVKAAAHADFLGLFRDVKNSRNRIVDSNLETVLFDFNLMFQPKLPNEPNYLLEDYLKTGDFMTDDLVKLYFTEQQAILKRVRHNEKNFFRFASIAGNLVDISYRTFNERVRIYYGAKSLEHYLEIRLQDFLTAK